MTLTLQKIKGSPLWIRVVPFALFLALTTLQAMPGPSTPYWMYLVKTLAGAGLIWWSRTSISEMRWAVSWEACVAGILVFAAWVGLDGLYPKWNGTDAPWNPPSQFGAGSVLAWVFIVARIAGSTLVVPPLEEVFYRSFLYRYITHPQFERVQLGAFGWQPLLVTSVIFGIVHREWLAGILCGLAFQCLVLWKGRLGDAMTAHAITNLLLGLWVVWKKAWHFW